jgi:tetratricopeptide (TPR) repeat protein
MNANFQKAQVLLEQGRFDLAEKELRLALAADPEDALVHAQLALCLAKSKRLEAALDEARLSIRKAPDNSYCHYVLASVQLDGDKREEAETAIQEAIRLDPEDPDYYALAANIQLARRKWRPALAMAEQGLRLDAGHIGCTNIRAIALNKVGRRQDAQGAIDTALRREPDNAMTHANQGWALLERGENERALEHFREALRLKPELEWAREGIITALKARHRIYRLILNYFFWMSKLSSRVQWALIIGGYLGYRFMLSYAKSHPSAAPWIWPVLGLYLLFVLLSWSADPIFNLLLRLSRFGRLALTRDEIVASNWVGAALCAALVSLVTWFILRSQPVQFTALFFGFMVIAISASFRCSQPRGRRQLRNFTIVLAAIGGLGLVMLYTGLSFGNFLMILFFVGFLLFSMTANAITLRS